jgi:amidophosphoribosyltransferase
MSGIFGVVSRENCIDDLFWGTFYLQHRAQDYCGLGFHNGEKLDNCTHEGLIRQQFPKEKLKKMKAYSGVGCVSGSRQPVSELSKSEGLILGYDGNLINYNEIKDKLLREGASFSGYNNPEEISDAVLISKIISRNENFKKGIEEVIKDVQGDFAVIGLTNEGVYAARGWGRKPLILGEKEGSYSVSSESNSFANTGFKEIRDVDPGEVVLLNKQGINEISKFDLEKIKYGTFEWIYTSYPPSSFDGSEVAQVRKDIGKILAQQFPVEADVVSPIPNSGRWHAIGYAKESKIPYEEVFVRYDYSDRSYTPGKQIDRDEEARTKLIPVRSAIEGNRVVIVDDSIVRGTQTLNQVERLKNEYGAKEVHARIACPPLMAACNYGKSTNKNEECIARRMDVEDIRKKLNLDSLEYANVEILEEAINKSRDELCLSCWEL